MRKDSWTATNFPLFHCYPVELRPFLDGFCTAMHCNVKCYLLCSSLCVHDKVPLGHNIVILILILMKWKEASVLPVLPPSAEPSLLYPQSLAATTFKVMHHRVDMVLHGTAEEVTSCFCCQVTTQTWLSDCGPLRLRVSFPAAALLLF